MLFATIITGCSQSGDETATLNVRGESFQTTPRVTATAYASPVSPDSAYPSPGTETPYMLTRDTVLYPAPLEVSKPVSSPDPTLTHPGGEISEVNPYPLQVTPFPQQAGLVNSSPYPSPYPPPGHSAPEVSSTLAVPSPSPRIGTVAIPTSQSTAIALGTTGLTPTAPTVKTRFIPTDPTTFILEAGRPQLVVFFADWCTLCKSIAPVVLGLESKYHDRLNFIYLDVDDSGTVAAQESLKYRLSSRPRIYLIDGMGLTLRDWMGYVPLEELQGAIESALSVSP